MVCLKGDGEFYTKKTDVKLVNVKYVTLLCILLHNLCIAMKDPCKPRWRLSVQELQLDDFMFDRRIKLIICQLLHLFLCKLYVKCLL